MPGVVVYDPDEAQATLRVSLLRGKLGDGWPIRGHHRRAALLRALHADPRRAREHVVVMIDLAADDDDTQLDGFELISTIVRHPQLRTNAVPVALTSHVNAWVLEEAAVVGAHGVVSLGWLDEADRKEVADVLRTLSRPRPPRQPQVPVWPADPSLFDRDSAERRFAARFAAWSGGLAADALTYELICQLAEGVQQTAMCPPLYAASRRLKAELQRRHGVAGNDVARLCRQFLAETGMRRPRRRKRGLDLDQLVVWATTTAIRENAFLDPAARELLGLLVDTAPMREHLTPGGSRSERARQERLTRVLAAGRAIVAQRPELSRALAEAGAVDLDDEILRIFDVLAKAADDHGYGEQLRGEAGCCDGEQRERLRALASECGA